MMLIVRTAPGFSSKKSRCQLRQHGINNLMLSSPSGQTIRVNTLPLSPSSARAPIPYGSGNATSFQVVLGVKRPRPESSSLTASGASSSSSQKRKREEESKTSDFVQPSLMERLRSSMRTPLLIETCAGNSLGESNVASTSRISPQQLES